MPDAIPPPAPAASPTTPDSSIGPVVNLIAQLMPAIAAVTAQSASVKAVLIDWGLADFVPWIGRAVFAAGVYAALVWHYRRALARMRPWALMVQRLMPWNRSA